MNRATSLAKKSLLHTSTAGDGNATRARVFLFFVLTLSSNDFLAGKRLSREDKNFSRVILFYLFTVSRRISSF